MRSYGARTLTAPLRRVLVRPPRPGDAARWREYGWRAEPEHARAAAEHEALCLLLEESGAEVVVAEGEDANPDAIYVYDPLLVGDDGAVLLRPGKEARQGEAAALEPGLERAGVPVAGRVEAPGTIEGGDTVWLGPETLLVGRGYRTNAAGVAQLASAFPDARYTQSCAASSAGMACCSKTGRIHPSQRAFSGLSFQT